MTLPTAADLKTLSYVSGGQPHSVYQPSTADTKTLSFASGGEPIFAQGGASDTAVDPGVGTLSITGYAPTVAQSDNNSVAPDVGALTLAGYAPTVAQSDNNAVAPDVGPITLTGYAPSVAQSNNQALAPGVGPLVLTGYAPTVAQSDNHFVAPDVGPITITGYAPTVARANDAYIQGGIFTLEFQIPVGDLGDPQTIIISERAMLTSETDIPADSSLQEWLTDPGTLKREVPIGTRTPGMVSPFWGSWKGNNVAAQFDDWVDYGTHGGLVICRYGPHRAPFPAGHEEVYRAYMDGKPTVGFDEVEGPIRGREYLFSKPMVTDGFDGTGDDQGTGVAGVRKRPIVMGSNWMQPILTDEVKNIWYLHSNSAVNTNINKHYDGGIPLEDDGSYTDIDDIFSSGDPVPGEYKHAKQAHGPVWVRFGAPIRFELRSFVQGDHETAEDPIARAWTICDIAKLAGVTEADALAMPTGSYAYEGGNRVVETQTYGEVLADIAKWEVSAIGFTRLDEFFARPIVPSSDAGAYAYIFDKNNTDERTYKVIPINGGKRVWKVNFQVGSTKKCVIAPTVADGSFQWINSLGEFIPLDAGEQTEMRRVKDELLRDPYFANFTASSASVLAADPGAEEVTIQIDADNCADQDAMEELAIRYLRVFGAQQFAMTFECDFTMPVARLELLDRVIVSHARFASAERFGKIYSIELKLKERRIGIGIWSHSDVPSDIVITQVDDAIGAGGGGAGSGVTGVGTAVQPDGRDFVIPLGSETVATTTGTPAKHFDVPYNFRLSEVRGALAESAGSNFTIDIEADGTTIMTDIITIDAGDVNSDTSATPPVILTNVLLKGTILTFPVTGSANGPVVQLIGERMQ